MVQTTLKPLNLEEFLQLPETKPASEYIDNQIIQKPLPQGKHSATQCELIFSLTLYSSPKKLHELFQNSGVHLAAGQQCLMFQYLSGTKFPQMITAKLLMSFP
ncbi:MULTISPECIES: Uma2 family endonuclease [unclassified Microcoleus]|uniref:Uma2 family endonuclease n=1 Tax=unclassified Microcoleus TaxID=2642155 RepID=UPI004040A809